MAKIVFQKPNILVLDEPTNHINFRHIPKIIEMMKNFR
jgi:ATP-binding cassette subfamily F protein 3